MMKVFINYRNALYGGGMILVAANTVEEAIEAFHEDPKYSYLWDCYGGDFYEYYYHADSWEEFPNVIANVDKPQVLAEGGYTE